MTHSPEAKRTVSVTLEHGLHMVPCSEIAKFVRAYPGSVFVCREQIRAEARSVLDLLQLKAEHGTLLVIEAQGEGAQDIVDGLARLFERNFEAESPTRPDGSPP